ncbi:MAG: prephenate dehydrogenase/arogenate dehydrogenase family protein [Betaproteobacteria bacterium]|nr:prephenate dehydrogenase/arogenate dehydrogenase family protein [Betaproteobacteria bacterium]
MKPIGKLVVIGVGLIGGSAALALRRAGLVGHVTGVGRSRANLDEALRLGILDAATDDYAEALAGADVVLVATPVAQMPAVFARIVPHLQPATIVTDGGSTKQDVIAAARAALGAKFAQFVPGHPIAGTEHTGAAAAFPELFRGRKVVLAPEPETDADATTRVVAMWEATGASVALMRAARHDSIFATVSHLPHLLAFALVEELALRPDAPEYFAFAAGGFRDFTRIASSSPEMWRDIAIANRDALLAELRVYRNQLERMERMLAESDGEGLGTLFATARAARNEWLAGRG